MPARAKPTKSLLPYASSPDDGAPRAYLAYMVFDKNWGFKPEKSGFKKISTLAAETGAGVTSLAGEGKAHEKLSITLDVTEPGYVYVYLTNQEATPKEVYFDDFTVTQLHSPFVAGGDYYPFGLAMADRQMDAEPYKWGYQGQYAEKDSLMNMYSFMLRMYDADVIHTITPDPYHQFASPYVWVGNNPVSGTDPTGGVCETCIAKTVLLEGVTVTAPRFTEQTLMKLFSVAAASSTYFVGNQTIFQNQTGTYTSVIATATNIQAFEYSKGSWDKIYDQAEDINGHSAAMKAFTSDFESAMEEGVMFYVGGEVGGVLLKPVLSVSGKVIYRLSTKIFTRFSPNISYLTKFGKYPSWTTVKARYWKLINNGSVPKGVAKVRMKETGIIKNIPVSKELHHVDGRKIADPHNFKNLKEVWPWEHAEIDDSRFINYEFLEWVK